MIEDVVQDNYLVKSDAEINDLIKKRRFSVDADHYSQAMALLRTEYDDTDLADLAEPALRTIAWKREWCVRFARAQVDIDAVIRPGTNLKDMERFIAANKDTILAWYFDTFGEWRPRGRQRQGRPPKAFDYPSAGGLKNWLWKWQKHRGKLEAFIQHYANCGNHDQIDPEVKEVVERRAREYASSRNPNKADVYEDVLTDLKEMNEGKPEEEWATVGETAVLRRINKLEPFKVRAGREGVDRAMRHFTSVGQGLDITEPLRRVEMDDWEMDLHVLVEKSSVWKALSKKQRDLVPRVRCSATVAIDVATRAIVGFNMTAAAPSTVRSKAALRSVLVDKSDFSAWAGAKSTWHMYGRGFDVATDGGPAFRGDFALAVIRSRMKHVLPEQDPRMRGTIESFFRLFRRLCRFFAGQAFSNVVEKGEYDAEKMASLTVDELYRLAVRFIVDLYHHRKHRGLEGRTPFAVWNERAAKGLRPPFSEKEIIAAFGIRAEATIDKHGVLYMGNSYQGGANGEPNLIAALHRILPNPKVSIVVDPFDLKTLFVCVPRAYRDHPELGNEDFVLAECLNPAVHGRTLDDLLSADANVRALAKREEAAGRPFRLGAHKDLRDAGEMTRARAGHPEFTFTQSEYDRAIAAMDRKGRAALGRVEYGADPIDDAGPLGTEIATAQRTGAVRTRHGSINTFGEEE